ncbi:2TM domain-containing protein [Lutibacter sp.]|uniref:2TM domain-containing protein n=1 Tax=Lutibacter sp. TaxID=1925666 RepID=UPI0027340047|nr:2TM domain-containing protein [Lutibacter sp.]MDP3312907.1 2TM domain-containing protein [Lutibacter sp.]
MEPTKEQHELYENARYRIKQKKRLYFHFVLFLVGSVFLIILNKVLNVGETVIEDWFVWAILVWFFLFVLHVINVFITERFMDRTWERDQIEKLVKKQELKIAQLEKDVAAKIKLSDESQKALENLKRNEEIQQNPSQE